MTLTDKDFVYLGHLSNQSRQKLRQALTCIAECQELNHNILDGVLGPDLLTALRMPLMQAEQAVTLAMTKIEKASMMAEQGNVTRERIAEALLKEDKAVRV